MKSLPEIIILMDKRRKYSDILTSDSDAAERFCNRIRKNLAEFNQQNNLPRELSISLGFAVLKNNSQDLEDIFNEADQQMYINKGRR